MKRINLITFSLSVSMSVLCSSLSAVAMDIIVEKEDLPTSIQQETRSTLIELIEEKISNQKKMLELYSQPNHSDMSLFMAVFMFGGNKSSPEFEELKRKCTEESEKQQEIAKKADLITQRNVEIDKKFPHALLDWNRERMTKTHGGDGENYNSSGKPFLSQGVMIGDHKIITIPDCLQTKAAQSIYTRIDPLTGLHYRMELLTDQNIKWYTERVALEAIIAYWNPLLKELEEKLPWLVDTFGGTPLETRIQQAFAPEPFDFGNSPTIKQLNFYEIMGMVSKGFDSLPLSFQEACQKYNLAETQVQDFLGALRGFEMNLRDYKNVPTWVAFASSEKIDNIQDIDPTSPIIKIMMTSTEGGPFYNPLGILRSCIALAFDEISYLPLSIPLHSFVASTMRGFDLENPNNNKWMITRPLPPMQKVFKISGVPYTESFGYEFCESHPSILRPGNYEDQNGKSIQFHDGQRYAAYVIFDPATKENYQIGRNHSFVQNYYLGGIAGRDMKFPFVMVNSDDLVKAYKWEK